MIKFGTHNDLYFIMEQGYFSLAGQYMGLALDKYQRLSIDYSDGLKMVYPYNSNFYDPKVVIKKYLPAPESFYAKGTPLTPIEWAI